MRGIHGIAGCMVWIEHVILLPSFSLSDNPMTPYIRVQSGIFAAVCQRIGAACSSIGKTHSSLFFQVQPVTPIVPQRVFVTILAQAALHFPFRTIQEPTKHLFLRTVLLMWQYVVTAKRKLLSPMKSFCNCISVYLIFSSEPSIA